MMTTIYLSATEKMLFEKLAEDLRSGWSVEEETLEFEDTPERALARMHLLRLQDINLKAVLNSLKETDSPEIMLEIIRDTDLSNVSSPDLAALFFAIGPGTISLFIKSLLAEAKSDKEIEHITALSVIRHRLLPVMQPASV